MFGLLNTREAGQALRIAEGTLRRWRSERRGPDWIKLGRKIFYDPVELQEYLEKCERRTQEE